MKQGQNEDLKVFLKNENSNLCSFFEDTVEWVEDSEIDKKCSSHPKATNGGVSHKTIYQPGCRLHGEENHELMKI